MTRDEILNMPAGTKMNQLIWWKIFDMTPAPPNNDMLLLHKYSTDIGAAYEVVEKLKPQFQEITIDADKDWRCCFDSACAFAETAPLAICRAALLAKVAE